MKNPNKRQLNNKRTNSTGSGYGSNKYKIQAAIFLAALITFVAYLPALQNGFVNWDDDEYVYENSNIQSIDYIFFTWIFTLRANPTWHPLTLLSFGLDYFIWGLNPAGYHLTNIIFHTLNTILVFILTGRLLKYKFGEKTDYKQTIIIGGITALLFGLHPLHVESVAWISERKDVLYAFFFLMSLLMYLTYTNPYSLFSRRLYYIFGIILFIMALMSKPMAVSLPFVLLILDFYPLNRLKTGEGMSGFKKVLIEKLPFFILSVLSSLIAIQSQQLGGALKSFENYPLLLRIYVAVRGYIFYLAKTIIPVNLYPLYPHPVSINFFSFEYLGSFI